MSAADRHSTATSGNSHLLLLVGLAGLLSLLEPQSGAAQNRPPQFQCRVDASGSGWDCRPRDGSEPPAAVGSTATPAPPLPVPSTSTPTEATHTAPLDEVLTTGAEADRLPLDPVQDPDLVSLEPAASGHPLDWIDREDMSPAQREALARQCCGGFVDPLVGLTNLDANPAEAPTSFNSVEGLRQESQGVIVIDGDIVVNQGYRFMTNDGNTRIDRDNETLSLEGQVEFREPGLLLRGDSALIDARSQVNRVENASYVLHDFGAHGQASAVQFDGDSGLVTIENGEFSRCEPEREFWRLRADSITLDPERGRGYARDVSLQISDVPIFYYPFTLYFPLGDQRVSGLLAPSLGSNRTGGTDFELPVYWNIAPHADATLAPRIISDRGLMTSAELRYLASWSMNQFNGSYLADDDLFDPTSFDLPGSESPPVPDRWFVGFDHAGALGRNWSTFVDYNAVSDTDYFYDLGDGGLAVASQTHLNRQGRLDFRSSWAQAGVNVQQIQLIDPLANANSINKPFARLPQLYFRSGGYLGAGFELDLDTSATYFDRDLDETRLGMNQLLNGALVNGRRLNIEPGLGWAVEQPGWFLRGDAKLKYIGYDLDNQAAGTSEDPEVTVPVYSADTGLVFERDRDGGGVQTLEPRLFYLRSDFEAQNQLPLFDTTELNFSFSQLFRDDRFAGGDRIGDADQLTLALTSRLLDRRGIERARFSVGQIRHFQDRRVSLSNPLQDWQSLYPLDAEKSALVGEAALSLGDYWRVNTDLQWNPSRDDVDEGSLQLRYHRDEDAIVNLSYRFRRLVSSPNFVLPQGIDPRINQTDFSVAWPVTANWTVLGRWNYDHANERDLERFAGVEWRNCCATIRLVAREWVDENELFVPNSEPNRGFYVQFILNGLGNIGGGSLSSLLRDGIWGFRESEYE